MHSSGVMGIAIMVDAVTAVGLVLAFSPTEMLCFYYACTVQFVLCVLSLQCAFYGCTLPTTPAICLNHDYCTSLCIVWLQYDVCLPLSCLQYAYYVQTYASTMSAI